MVYNLSTVGDITMFRDVGSMGVMGAWVPINISSGTTTGRQRACTIH